MRRRIPWIWIIAGIAVLALISQNQNPSSETSAEAPAPAPFNLSYEQEVLPYQDGLRASILVLVEGGGDYLQIAQKCRDHYLNEYQGVFCFVYDQRKHYAAESESKPCFKARALRQLNGEEISELANPAAPECS